MSQTGRLNELNKFEHSLIMKFISYTKEYNKEHIFPDELREMGDEVGVPAALYTSVSQRLFSKKFLLLVPSGGISRVEIHPDFYEEALQYYSSDVEHDPSLIPAADRFVHLDDNQPELADAKEALAELSHAIKGSNDLFANYEERILVSKEVDQLQHIISKRLIHVSSVWDAVKNNSTLKWLAEQAISGVVRQGAVKALAALGALLKHILH